MSKFDGFASDEQMSKSLMDEIFANLGITDRIRTRIKTLEPMSHEFNYDTFLLALTMQREARGEGRDGMRAVGHVIRNRNLAGWGSIYDCITKKNQFTSMSVPGDGQLTHWPRPMDMLDQLHDAKRILEGEDSDLTEGALYYCNPKTATSNWFKTLIVDDPTNHPVTLTLGNHVFYA